VIVNTLEPNVVAPKLVRAVAAVVAFVPPLAIGNVPVTLVVRFVNVVEVVPVPPLAIGSVPVTSEARLTKVEAIFTKSEPFQATSALYPEVTVTPVVGPAPRITTEPVPALMMM